ncbi:hypothetical protein [Rhodococcoides fascians]|uniref:hypothetical protein n=1 Tax=Rhodococcoides fascians TaxID=1828 RepID=UPI00050C7FD6|nr:hypothetical protein [Rhodococcus fascians]
MSNEYFQRGTPEYDAACEILGESSKYTEEESARQINQRWLKVTRFVHDNRGELWWNAETKDFARYTQRVRIPRSSPLARRKVHK